MSVPGFLKVLFSFVMLTGMSSAFAADIEFNGFGSLNFAQNLESELRAPLLIDSKADFSTFSLFGLNVSGSINEQMSVAAQIIAASKSATGDWAMNANWVYLTYVPRESVSIKLGRQLFPIFIGSEYDKVGQLLPYRRIPALSTLAPFSGFTGISVATTWDFNDTLKLTASVFGGRPDYELTVLAKSNGFIATADELLGGTLTLDGDGFRIRAMANTTRASLTQSAAPCQPSCESRVQQFSLGYRYDKHDFVSWGEVMNRKGKDGTLVGTVPYLNSLKGGYLLLGYSLGAWLPRYTYTRSDADIGVFTGGYDAHGVGFNYELAPSATLKVDYETFKALSNGSYGLIRAGTNTRESAQAIYAGIDFIF